MDENKKKEKLNESMKVRKNKRQTKRKKAKKTAKNKGTMNRSSRQPRYDCKTRAHAHVS